MVLKETLILSYSCIKRLYGTVFFYFCSTMCGLIFTKTSFSYFYISFTSLQRNIYLLKILDPRSFINVNVIGQYISRICLCLQLFGIKACLSKWCCLRPFLGSEAIPGKWKPYKNVGKWHCSCRKTTCLKS